MRSWTYRVGTVSGTWQAFDKISVLCYIMWALHCPLWSSAWPMASWYPLPDPVVHGWESEISEIFRTWGSPILFF